MKTSYEYIVLGLGGIGSGAAYWLARQAGKEVLGLEQFELDHVRGGSQDHSRIIRLSYHTPAYVELAKATYPTWAELEADADTELIVQSGGLDFFPEGGIIPMEDYTSSMDATNVPYEHLNATETMKRWPQFKLTDDVQVLYQEKSGIAPAAKCVAAHLRMAAAHGATLKPNSPVERITPVGDEIEVVAGGITYRCRHLTIAAGAWTNKMLAHFGRQIHLTVTQEQVAYYGTPHAAEFMPDRFPIWIWMDEPCYYGFPVYGEAGPKVSQDVGGQPVTPDTRSFEPDPAYQQRLDHFVQQYIPRAYGPPLLVKTCLYTLPPDRDFVLSPLPDQPNVTVAVGAAHAFKFSSLMGRILSQLAATGTTSHDISPFDISRQILYEANPVFNYMT